MYPQQPTPQVRPRRKKKPNKVLLVVLSSVLGALVICVAATVIYGLTSGDKPDTSAGATAAAAPKLDDAGKLACDDFAKGYKAAQTKTARVDLANKVNKWASKSTTDRIANMGAALGRGADGNADGWTMAADAFAIACTDAGWTAG